MHGKAPQVRDCSARPPPPRSHIGGEARLQPALPGLRVDRRHGGLQSCSLPVELLYMRSIMTRSDTQYLL